MNQFIGGYCQVLAANDVKYVISYPGSFSDTALGKEVTEDMQSKKEQLGLEDTFTMDIDGNGIVDEEDVTFIKKSIFSSF